MKLVHKMRLRSALAGLFNKRNPIPTLLTIKSWKGTHTRNVCITIFGDSAVISKGRWNCVDVSGIPNILFNVWDEEEMSDPYFQEMQSKLVGNMANVECEVSYAIASNKNAILLDISGGKNG